MKLTFDAVVVGAGVLGCSVAHALARNGLDVCVVERGPAPGTGSTSASSAVVRYNYSTWAGVAAAWESKHAWEAWEEHLGTSDDAGMARFLQTGGLQLSQPGQNPEKVLGLFARAGVPCEEWDAGTIRAHMPFLDTGRYYPPRALSDPGFWAEPHGEVSGYWMPDSGFIDDPQLAAHNLAVAAAKAGADLRYRTAVAAIRRRGGRVSGVTLADGTRIGAPVVVNVAGPHSARISEMAGVLDDFTIKTRPLRQEVHEVEAPPGYHTGEPGPLVADLDLGTYFRGTPGGGVLIGGTEPKCDPLQWLDDPDDYQYRATKPVFDAQVLRVARRMPGLRVPEVPRGIAGVYDVADDWIPIYDKTRLDGYYVAIGTSGNQFKNAPVVGLFLAAIIEACESGRNHDTDPVEVTLPRTGHTIDLAHYSRKREINPDSSFSVMG